MACFAHAEVPGAAASVPPAAAVAAPGMPKPVMGLLVHLKNEFDYTCVRVAPIGDQTRLYFDVDGLNYMDLSSASIASVTEVALPSAAKGGEALPRAEFENRAFAVRQTATPGAPEIASAVADAAAKNVLDTDIIQAIIRQESNGNVHAVSRVGAQGLMQLMPQTARTLGVRNAFDFSENIHGGTAYFNSLLLKYHDSLPLALAAYNAGPAAVDKYHGVPPYRETRAYVNRIIRDFNRRKAELAKHGSALAPHASALAAGIVH